MDRGKCAVDDHRHPLAAHEAAEGDVTGADRFRAIRRVARLEPRRIDATNLVEVDEDEAGPDGLVIVESVGLAVATQDDRADNGGTERFFQFHVSPP